MYSLGVQCIPMDSKSSSSSRSELIKTCLSTGPKQFKEIMDFLELHDKELKSKTSLFKQLDRMIRENQISKTVPENKRNSVYSITNNSIPDIEMKGHFGEESKKDDNLLELKQQIYREKQELALIGNPPPSSPELITSTNLLRKNEFLTKLNEKKTVLVDLYVQYVSKLELSMTETIEIQKNLCELQEKTTDLSKSNLGFYQNRFQNKNHITT